MDFTSVVVGGVIGFVAGALVLTATGREITKATYHRGSRTASRAGRYAAKRIRG